MKSQYITRTVIAFLTLILATSCKNLEEHTSQTVEEYFQIEVVQNGKVVPVTNNTVILKKEPFKFKVSLIKTNDVSVSASWDKYYYDYPDDNNIFECEDKVQFKECRFVAIKTGNQAKFNSDKQLLIGDGNYQWNWFYDETMDWHRMDSVVTVEDGVIHAELTVENIFDCDGRDARLESSEFEYAIENIEKDIYMVFATSHYEKGMSHPDELQREKFKIQFEHDD